MHVGINAWICKVPLKYISNVYWNNVSITLMIAIILFTGIDSMTDIIFDKDLKFSDAVSILVVVGLVEITRT